MKPCFTAALFAALLLRAAPVFALPDPGQGELRPFYVTDVTSPRRPTASQPVFGTALSVDSALVYWVDRSLFKDDGTLGRLPGGGTEGAFTDDDFAAIFTAMEVAVPADPNRGAVSILQEVFGDLTAGAGGKPWMLLYPVPDRDSTPGQNSFCQEFTYHRPADFVGTAADGESNGSADAGVPLVYVHAGKLTLRDTCNNVARLYRQAIPDEAARALVRRAARARDADEQAWIVEAMALYGAARTRLNPLSQEQIRAFMTNPNTQITDTNLGRNYDPGVLTLLATFLAEQFAPENSALKALMAEPADGSAGLDKVLKALNAPDASVEAFLMRFGAALYLDADDPAGAVSPYGFRSLQLPRLIVAKQISLPNVRATRTDRVNARPFGFGFAEIDTRAFGPTDRMRVTVRYDVTPVGDRPPPPLPIWSVQLQDPRAGSFVRPFELVYRDTPVETGGAARPRYEGSFVFTSLGPTSPKVLLETLVWSDLPQFAAFAFEVVVEGNPADLVEEEEPEPTEPEPEIDEADADAVDDEPEAEPEAPADLDLEPEGEISPPIRRDFGGGGGCSGGASTLFAALTLLATAGLAGRVRRHTVES